MREQWSVIAASVTGSRHERAELPCQDACKHKIAHAESILITAVADGAGSAPRAKEGAEQAAKTAVEAVDRTLKSLSSKEGGKLPDNETDWQEIVKCAAEEARHAIQELARSHELPQHDFATTLILAVIKPGGIVTFQVGDGAVVIQDKHGQLLALTKPQVEEYLNETIFLTSDEALQRAQCQFWEGDFSHVALFSDGLDLLALQLPDMTPYEPFFKPLFQFADQWAHDPDEGSKHLEKFLRSERVRAHTDDDLTLLLVCKRDSDESAL
jgi:serine/threonine protein phosphatase PrpC